MLSEKFLLRSINAFKEWFSEIKSYDDFYYVKSAFLIAVKNSKKRLR
jgi:hypothetical protein